MFFSPDLIFCVVLLFLFVLFLFCSFGVGDIFNVIKLVRK